MKYNKIPYVIVLIFLIGILNCSSTAQYSNNSKQLLKRLINAEKSGEQVVFSPIEREKFLIKKSGDMDVVHGTIRIMPPVDKKRLTDLGIQVNSTIGQVLTVVIPLNSLHALSKIKGVIYIQIDTPVKMKK